MKFKKEQLIELSHPCWQIRNVFPTIPIRQAILQPAIGT